MRAEAFRTNHMSRRHCDGIISSVIDKLKGIYQSIKSKYERLYPVGKILKIIGKALQLFGAINFSRRVPEFIRTYKELTKVKVELVNSTKEFEAQKEAARKEGFAVPSGEDIGNMVNPYAKTLNENKMETFKLDLMLHAAINATSVGIGILLDIVGGIMKKRGAVKAKDSYYPSISRRCDARAIRYCDGGLDRVFDKLRELYNKAKETFKELPIGKKILFVLGKIIKIISAASVATDIATLVALKMQVIKYNSLVDGLFNSVTHILPFKPLEKTLGVATAPFKYLSKRVITQFSRGVQKPVIFRIIVATISTAIGLISEKIAVMKGK